MASDIEREMADFLPEADMDWINDPSIQALTQEAMDDSPSWSANGSEEEILSFGSPSSGLDCQSNGSWMMVAQTRPDVPSPVNDSALQFSSPSEGLVDWPWTASGGGLDPLEPFDADQMLLFQDFSDPGSQSDTYQLTPMSSDGDHFSLLEANVLSDESWNPLQHRASSFTPENTAAGSQAKSPSGASPASDSTDDTRSKSSQKSSTTRAKTRKAISKTAALEWNHSTIGVDGRQLMVNETSEKKERCIGVRRGKLDPSTKEKAKRVRKVKACWNCWILKVPCSEGGVCERCVKHCSKRSPASDQLCSRAGFVDYDTLFFPEYLFDHLEKRKIKELIETHTIGFTDISFQVEVATGSCFAPMALSAHVFKPRTHELLQSYHLIADSQQRQQMVPVYTAPIGLMALSTADLKCQLRGHLETMIKNPQYALQTTAGDASQIPFLLLEAIREYSLATESSLLHHAMLLHASHYYMGASITFSETSANLVHQTVQPFGAPPGPFLSSKLLNRQLKYAMHKLQQDVVREVLERLEKSMRSRSKDSWGGSFCALLLLFSCIERLQISAETFIVCDIEKTEREGIPSRHSRSQSSTACQALDEYPFENCTRLFHDIYRSKREQNSNAREGAFNPLKSPADSELDKETEKLVESISWIIQDKYDELQELSARSGFVSTDQVSPHEVKIKGQGRLIAKFLMSFFP